MLRRTLQLVKYNISHYIFISNDSLTDKKNLKDNVLSRIIANKDIDFNTLRIGNVARMSSNVRCKALEEQLCLKYESDSSSDIDELNESLMRSLTIEEPNEQKEIHYVTRTSDQVLREADVIFCTLNG